MRTLQLVTNMHFDMPLGVQVARRGLCCSTGGTFLCDLMRALESSCSLLHASSTHARISSIRTSRGQHEAIEGVFSMRSKTFGAD